MSVPKLLATLEGVIRYLHRQQPRTQEEYEDHAVALRLLHLIRDGWTPNPGLFDVACGYALGLPSGRLHYKRTLRAAHMQQQYLRLIPDYDYSQDISAQILLERDPKDGRRRHYNGNRFRHLAAQRDKAAESITACGPNEYNTAANLGLGSWPTADDQHLAPALGCSPGHASDSAADRGRTPRKISSPAQLAIEGRVRAANRMIYFGA